MSNADTSVAVEADFVEELLDAASFENAGAHSKPDRHDEWVTIAEAAKRLNQSQGETRRASRLQRSLACRSHRGFGLGVSADRVRRRLKAGEFEARQVASRYGPTWEIHLGDLTQPDSSSPRVTPTVAPRVTHTPRVAPTLAPDELPDDEGTATVELVRLVRHQQDQLTQLAGQVGFLQAQLQQAHETIKLLQAPPTEMADDEATTIAEELPQTIVMATEVGRLKAELEQAQRRVAEFEASADELEREHETAAAEAARRPWWRRFWG
jgi:hypothetical protein